MSRDDAYRIVQSAAATSWAERRPFRAVLDAALTDRPGVRASLDQAFDLQRSVGHAGSAVDALTAALSAGL
jgi:adenylosuccinate lyase